MSKFNENIIGKLYRENNYCYIVCGYDYINQSYIAANLNRTFLVYTSIEDSKLTELKTFNEIIQNYDEQIEKLKEITEIYNNTMDSLESILDKQEFNNVFNRLYQTNINIKSLQNCIGYSSTSETKKFYEDRLRESYKGLRRAKKRLYRYFNGTDYYTIKKFLVENNYNIRDTIYKYNNLQRSKNTLIESYRENYEAILKKS